ncbi:MAG: hypothetical protein ACE5H1_10225 [Thermodesulfobacteriota bacterium]
MKKIYSTILHKNKPIGEVYSIEPFHLLKTTNNIDFLLPPSYIAQIDEDFIEIDKSNPYSYIKYLYFGIYGTYTRALASQVKYI